MPGPTHSMLLGLVETCRARTSLVDRAGSCPEGQFMLLCSSDTGPLFPASIHIVLFTTKPFGYNVQGQSHASGGRFVAVDATR